MTLLIPVKDSSLSPIHECLVIERLRRGGQKVADSFKVNLTQHFSTAESLLNDQTPSSYMLSHCKANLYIIVRFQGYFMKQQLQGKIQKSDIIWGKDGRMTVMHISSKGYAALKHLWTTFLPQFCIFLLEAISEKIYFEGLTLDCLVAMTSIHPYVLSPYADGIVFVRKISEITNHKGIYKFQMKRIQFDFSSSTTLHFSPQITNNPFENPSFFSKLWQTSAKYEQISTHFRFSTYRDEFLALAGDKVTAYFLDRDHEIEFYHHLRTTTRPLKKEDLVPIKILLTEYVRTFDQLSVTDHSDIWEHRLLAVPSMLNFLNCTRLSFQFKNNVVKEVGNKLLFVNPTSNELQILEVVSHLATQIILFFGKTMESSIIHQLVKCILTHIDNYGICYSMLQLLQQLCLITKFRYSLLLGEGYPSLMQHIYSSTAPMTISPNKDNNQQPVMKNTSLTKSVTEAESRPTWLSLHSILTNNKTKRYKPHQEDETPITYINHGVVSVIPSLNLSGLNGFHDFSSSRRGCENHHQSNTRFHRRILTRKKAASDLMKPKKESHQFSSSLSCSSNSITEKVNNRRHAITKLENLAIKAGEDFILMDLGALSYQHKKICQQDSMTDSMSTESRHKTYTQEYTLYDSFPFEGKFSLSSLLNHMTTGDHKDLLELKELCNDCKLEQPKMVRYALLCVITEILQLTISNNNEEFTYSQISQLETIETYCQVYATLTELIEFHKEAVTCWKFCYLDKLYQSLYHLTQIQAKLRQLRVISNILEPRKCLKTNDRITLYLRNCFQEIRLQLMQSNPSNLEQPEDQTSLSIFRSEQYVYMQILQNYVIRCCHSNEFATEAFFHCIEELLEVANDIYNRELKYAQEMDHIIHSVFLQMNYKMILCLIKTITAIAQSPQIPIVRKSLLRLMLGVGPISSIFQKQCIWFSVDTAADIDPTGIHPTGNYDTQQKNHHDILQNRKNHNWIKLEEQDFSRAKTCSSLCQYLNAYIHLSNIETKSTMNTKHCSQSVDECLPKDSSMYSADSWSEKISNKSWMFLDDIDWQSSILKGLANNSNEFDSNLKMGNNKYLNNLDYLMDPNSGILSQFLAQVYQTTLDKWSTKIAFVVRDVLDVFLLYFRTPANKYLRSKYCTDFYIRFHFSQFLKHYCTELKSPLSLEICCLHLNILEQFASSRTHNASIIDIFYNLKFVEFFVKDLLSPSFQENNTSSFINSAKYNSLNFTEYEKDKKELSLHLSSKLEILVNTKLNETQSHCISSRMKNDPCLARSQEEYQKNHPDQVILNGNNQKTSTSPLLIPNQDTNVTTTGTNLLKLDFSSRDSTSSTVVKSLPSIRPLDFSTLRKKQEFATSEIDFQSNISSYDNPIVLKKLIQIDKVNCIANEGSNSSLNCTMEGHVDPTLYHSYDKTSKQKVDFKESLLYKHDKMHLQVVLIILNLIVSSDDNSLESLYCCQYPMNHNTINFDILYSLHLHINHPKNEKLRQNLSMDISCRSQGVIRLFHLLCTSSLDCSNYRITNLISRGAFGTVYRGTTSLPLYNAQNQKLSEIAIKCIDRPTNSYRRCVLFDIFSEISILEKLRGNIMACQMLDYGVTQDCYYIVLEYIPKTLMEWRNEYVHNNSKETGGFLYPILKVFEDIALAVREIHENGVVHYDLKGDNILLRHPPHLFKEGSYGPNHQSDPCICLIDFGEAWLQELHDEGRRNNKRNRGTEAIKSPEMLLVETDDSKSRTQIQNDRRKASGTSSASDIWSLGCLLYELVTGEFLFNQDEFASFYYHLTKSNEMVLRKSHLQTIHDTIFHTEVALDTHLQYQGEKLVLDLLHAMLVRDPTRRPSASLIVQKLRYVDLNLCGVLSNSNDKTNQNEVQVKCELSSQSLIQQQKNHDPPITPSIITTQWKPSPLLLFRIGNSLESRPFSTIPAHQVAQGIHLSIFIPVPPTFKWISDSLPTLWYHGYSHAIFLSTDQSIVHQDCIFSKCHNITSIQSLSVLFGEKNPCNNKNGVQSFLRYAPFVCYLIQSACANLGKLILIASSKRLGNVAVNLLCMYIVRTYRISIFDAMVHLRRVLGSSIELEVLAPLLQWESERISTLLKIRALTFHGPAFECICGACTLIVRVPLDTSMHVNPSQCDCPLNSQSGCPPLPCEKIFKNQQSLFPNKSMFTHMFGKQLIWAETTSSTVCWVDLAQFHFLEKAPIDNVHVPPISQNNENNNISHQDVQSNNVNLSKSDEMDIPLASLCSTQLTPHTTHHSNIDQQHKNGNYYQDISNFTMENGEYINGKDFFREVSSANKNWSEWSLGRCKYCGYITHVMKDPRIFIVANMGVSSASNSRRKQVFFQKNYSTKDTISTN